MSNVVHHIVPNASPPPPSSMWSHAVEAGGWLHVTGQLPIDPDDPEAPLRDGVVAQGELCFENLRRILAYTGYRFEDVVFVRIYLKEFERDFAPFNGVYGHFFQPLGGLPSRTTVGVAALGRDALVEIDLVCFKGEGG